jgi:tRNA-splicing endonuclease subunit Sen34
MIVHDPSAHHTPTHSQLEAWDISRRQDITNQLLRLERRKAEDRDKATATSATTTTNTPAQDESAARTAAATIQQKRAERKARRRQLAEEAASEAATQVDTDTDPNAEGSKGRHGDAPSTTTSNNANAIYTVSVPTTSDAFAWYDSNDDDPARHTYTYETLDAARAADVWNYPSNAEERARCEVFRDLWEKGYYMGGGSKFGGDWLVYPGA